MMRRMVRVCHKKLVSLRASCYWQIVFRDHTTISTT
jgi:hypothetical protein